MSKDIPEQEFVQMLVERGWTEEEAKAEWQAIQNDDESGYDGP